MVTSSWNCSQKSSSLGHPSICPSIHRSIHPWHGGSKVKEQNLQFFSSRIVFSSMIYKYFYNDYYNSSLSDDIDKRNSLNLETFGKLLDSCDYHNLWLQLVKVLLYINSGWLCLPSCHFFVHHVPKISSIIYSHIS